MSQSKAGRRKPFACGHRGLGLACHRCAQADAAFEGSDNIRGSALRSVDRGPAPNAMSAAKAARKKAARAVYTVAS